MKFVKFTEHNDHEGESWVFWLQQDGNENELKKLNDFLVNNDLYEGYELDTRIVVEENTVDDLVKHGGGGYMNYHNKVTGTFIMPVFKDDGEEDSAWEFVNDEFYKGDIERHFA